VGPIHLLSAHGTSNPKLGTVGRLRSYHQLTILYGKYGYYFKCSDCDGNTPIKVTGANGEKAKLSKQGREFYVVCSEALAPQLFYINPKD
jgi:hypothetical protein